MLLHSDDSVVDEGVEDGENVIVGHAGEFRHKHAVRRIQHAVFWRIFYDQRTLFIEPHPPIFLFPEYLSQVFDFVARVWQFSRILCGVDKAELLPVLLIRQEELEERLCPVSLGVSPDGNFEMLHHKFKQQMGVWTDVDVHVDVTEENLVRWIAGDKWVGVIIVQVRRCPVSKGLIKIENNARDISLIEP